VGFGIALLVLGGFLLGGAYSVWNGGGDPEVLRHGRSGPQVAVAVVLLLAAALASVSGVLYLL
jgi:uncharacterized protein involved in response to NO